MPCCYTRKERYSSALFNLGWSTPGPDAFNPGKEPLLPIVQAAGWAPGSVWAGMERRKPLVPTGVRTQNRPARSESLQRLRYHRPPDRTHDVTVLARSSSINLVPDTFSLTVLITAVQSSSAQIAHAPKYGCACLCAHKHVLLLSSFRTYMMC
jgi:hypothetical protein